MTKEQFLSQCVYDAISALSVPNLPDKIQVGEDWIYPRVAIARLRSIHKIDQLFPTEK